MDDMMHNEDVKIYISELLIKWYKHIPSMGPVYYFGYVGEINIFTIKKSLARTGIYVLVSDMPDTQKHTEYKSIEEAKAGADTILRSWMIRLFS